MTSDFQERVYTLCSEIPRGFVSTYGIMAKRLNSSPRAVGGALKRNPRAPKVPCHRVIKSDLSIGGFNGETNIKGEKICKKMKLLASEGVLFKEHQATTLLLQDPTLIYTFSNK